MLYEVITMYSTRIPVSTLKLRAQPNPAMPPMMTAKTPQYRAIRSYSEVGLISDGMTPNLRIGYLFSLSFAVIEASHYDRT